MRVDCTLDKTMPAEVRTEAERLAEARFARFGRTIDAVKASVMDVNGPRGGVDIRCRLLVKIHRGKQIVIDETAASVREALTAAFERAGHAVSRRIDRLARGRRRAPVGV